MTDTGMILVLVLVVLVLIAWQLTYNASRLDRLHTRVEGALSALDAQLVRRAEATLELANSGELDPASSLLLASAASESLERQTDHALADDLLDGLSFAGREAVESDLSEALGVALTPSVVAELRDRDGVGAAALTRVVAAGRRVQLARRFHNNLALDARRVRRKRAVRWFRLAGHATMPQTVEFDDALPPTLES
ncbi:putative secreted protein [Nostocoides japonicum T1-X7]|uniref:Putative secreted protein n=1 Tax=Nostocoides japonicum T1-X7 TaxID=1194083 RepID=A0A077LTX3_9MICO|nr:hypothetical protein [Tetrasphaera japonica]CCH75972.1 putative secreted protein [Tetrasphaera japonica T1-X7]